MITLLHIDLYIAMPLRGNRKGKIDICPTKLSGKTYQQEINGGPRSGELKSSGEW